MVKIGTVTIGQSPRTDVVPEMEPILGKGVQIVQAGALDGLTKEEMRALAPEEGGTLLVSRLRDGSWVRLEEEKILPLMQKQIRRLEEEGVSLTAILCTGSFPDTLTANGVLLFPQNIMYGVVPQLTVSGQIAVIAPEEGQLEQVAQKWEACGCRAQVVSANPYAGIEPVIEAAKRLAGTSAEIVVLDCIGYHQAMKEAVRQITGKPVVLPRTLLARIISEMVL